MAKPLTKRRRNGDRYCRPPNIEAAIDGALELRLEELLRRAGIREVQDADYMPPECLVHLIRKAVREGAGETVNRLLPILLGRCERNLRATVAEDSIPNVAWLREEILAEFAALFANDGKGDRGDQLDFYEIRFNRAFRVFRVDAVRREQKDDTSQSIVRRADDAGPSLRETEEEALTRLSGLAQFFRAESDEAPLRADLRDAIRRLPDNERRAVTLHYRIGYKVESENPQERTVATICGVTGRTIRNRLSGAIRRFKDSMGDPR